MRLIDADDAKKWASEHILDAKERYGILDFLRDCATIDAVEVVRCKDCVHWDDDPDTYGPKGKCMKSFETMCADDFCSYGEHK